MEIRGVTKSLVDHLRVEIVTGQLLPGQRLNEVQLASRLGVSRPPLREAFRILEHDHLVASIPRKGTYVTHISPEDFEEVSRAREMIECYAVDLLEEMHVRDLPMVASALAKTSGLSIPANLDSVDLLTYRDTFADFHVKLIASSGNAWLVHFYQAIASTLARYEYLHFSFPEAASRSIDDHQRILELIRQGDYREAKEVLRAHIAYVYQYAKKAFMEGERF